MGLSQTSDANEPRADSNPPDTESQTTENGDQTEATATTTEEKQKSSPVKKTKKVFKQVDLPVVEDTYSMKKKTLDEAFEREV